MKTKLKATGTTLTGAIREWIEMKVTSPVSRLIKKYDDAAILEIDFGKSTKHHKKGDVWFAEGNLSFNGSVIRVEAFADDVRAAIDNLARELKEDIKKFSEKNVAKARVKERALKKKIKKGLR